MAHGAKRTTLKAIIQSASSPKQFTAKSGKAADVRIEVGAEFEKTMVDPFQPLLGLSPGLLGFFTFSDIADVTLNHLYRIHQIYVTDKFDLLCDPLLGLQRQILIADVILFLQFGESFLVGNDILE